MILRGMSGASTGATMGNNGQQWSTMVNNGQQWTTMDNNGQQSAVLHAFVMQFLSAPQSGALKRDA